MKLLRSLLFLSLGFVTVLYAHGITVSKSGLTSGAAVASAATITPSGNSFHVTGVTTITAITVLAADTKICAIFDGILTVTDNNTTLNTAGNFVTTADDILCLVSDGTNWRESSRSVN